MKWYLVSLVPNLICSFYWGNPWGVLLFLQDLVKTCSVGCTCLASVTDLGFSMSYIVCTFSGSGFMSSWSMTWPRNFTELVENTHFSFLMVTCNFCSCSSTVLKHSLCSCWFDPWMRISSIRHVIPVRPSRAVDICCWKNSAAGMDEMPKGNQLKQTLPKGVINFV